MTNENRFKVGDWYGDYQIITAVTVEEINMEQVEETRHISLQNKWSGCITTHDVYTTECSCREYILSDSFLMPNMAKKIYAGSKKFNGGY